MPKRSPLVDIEFQPGIDQLMSRVGSLPKVYIDELIDEVGEYAVGVFTEKQPRYKYISRAQAYPNAPAGPGWFSERQRKYVMARIDDGSINIPYHRTGQMMAAWKLRKGDDNFSLVNDAPGIQFVMGEQQSKHEEMVGWKKASVIIAGALTFRSSKFREAVNRAYQKAIRKLKFDDTAV